MSEKKDPNELMTGPGMFALIALGILLTIVNWDSQPGQIWDWYWNQHAQLPVTDGSWLPLLWNAAMDIGVIRFLFPVAVIGGILYQSAYELLLEFKDKQPAPSELQLQQSFQQAYEAGQLESELQQQITTLASTVKELTLSQAAQKAQDIDVPSYLKDVFKDPQAMLVHLRPKFEKLTNELLELHSIKIKNKTFEQKIELLQAKGLINQIEYDELNKLRRIGNGPSHGHAVTQAEFDYARIVAPGLAEALKQKIAAAAPSTALLT